MMRRSARSSRMREYSVRSNGITHSRPDSGTRTGATYFQGLLSKLAARSRPANSSVSLRARIPVLPPILNRHPVVRVDVGGQQQERTQSAEGDDAIETHQQPDVVEVQLGDNQSDEAEAEHPVEPGAVHDAGADQQQCIAGHHDGDGGALRAEQVLSGCAA